MKVMITLVVSLIFLQSSALAMIFNPPERIGHINLERKKGFIFTDVAENIIEEKNLIKIGKKDPVPTEFSVKGIAQFGYGEDAIYFHYNYANKTRERVMSFGSKNSYNTFNMLFEGYATIYKVPNDEGKNFYMIGTLLKNTAKLSSIPDYVLLSCNENGTFKKEFDTSKFANQLFGQYAEESMRTFNFVSLDIGDCIVSENIIAFPYKQKKSGSGFTQEEVEEMGLLCFIWNESTQKFESKKVEVHPSEEEQIKLQKAKEINQLLHNIGQLFK